MAKSLVIYGPKACGKTRNGAMLAKKFDLTSVVELADINGLTAIHSSGVLYLHFDKIIAERTAHRYDLRTMTFDAAMQWPCGGAK